MENSEMCNANYIKNWETFKILNRLRENIHQKRKSAKEKTAEDAIGMPIVTRLQLSNRELAELMRDGEELITNIRIANDRREIDRRKLEAKKRYELINDLKKESAEATNKVAAINSLWAELGDGKDPMTLNEGLEYQNTRILNLMNQKDEIIEELHQALKQSDERYNLDQEKQIADIECLIERIDSQVEVMRIAYRKHLELLHDSIEAERLALKQSHSSKWQDLFNDRAEAEALVMSDAKATAELYENNLKSIQVEHEELNRITRIKLDCEVDMLQCELEHVKADTMLNREKLDYNHHVLQKRAEENALVRNQQKQRLNKMRAFIAVLRKKIEKNNQMDTMDMVALEKNVLRLSEAIDEMEIKIDLFARNNDKKFQYVWEMHEKDVKKLIENIFTINKVLHEEFLDLKWTKCNADIKEKEDLKSFQSAITTLNSNNGFHITEMIKHNVACMQDDMESKFLRHIIEQIINQTFWLLDEKLDMFMEPVANEDKRKLVRIDNIFKVLGINSVKHVVALKEYFLPHLKCLNCDKSYNQIWKENQRENILLDIENYAYSPGMSTTSSSSDSINGVNMELRPKIGEERTDRVCSNLHDHDLIIERGLILPVLQKYVYKFNYLKPVSEKEHNIDSNLTLSRLISQNDINAFWKSHQNAYLKDDELLWSALDIGFNKYLQVLKKRDQLQADCDLLHRQNLELMHLLQSYIPIISE